MNYIIKPLEGFAEGNQFLSEQNKKLFNSILGGGVLIKESCVHVEVSSILVNVGRKYSILDNWIPLYEGTYKVIPIDINLPNGKWYEPLSIQESPLVEMYEKEIEAATTKHSHYFKDCPYDKVDVYRILEIFDVTDPCIQHCVKKLLCAGGRGHKDINLDINNVIDTLQRWKDMREEEKNLEN